MALRWYCQVLGEELGPVSWNDMVQMARAGTLGESDLVRRDEHGQWEPAKQVVGLFRAARQGSASDLKPPAASETSHVAAAETPAEQSTASTRDAGTRRTKHRKQERSDEQLIASEDVSAASHSRSIVIVSLIVVLLVVVGTALWASRAARFPPHQMTAAREGIATPAHLLDAPAPKSPSIPSLPAKTATLVPGLEAFENTYSPCLSADLKAIVFAHMADGKTGYDLYVSTRNRVDDLFSPPRLIVGCQSEECDAYPTLSPDLKALVFVRSDDHPQLMCSTRATADGEFGPAAACGPSDSKVTGKVGFPQFVDRSTISFAEVQADPPSRKVWLAKRDKAGAFSPLQLLACYDSWAPWYISAGGVRAYYGFDQGLFVAARQSPSHPLGNAVLWADASQAGPIDGPIWVSPQEDVIFYCSAGPGKKMSDGRKLWMWRK